MNQKTTLRLPGIFFSLLCLCLKFTYAQEVFINEIHYDNAGADANEGIELAGPADLDLTGYQIVLYNGNGGAVYNTINLDMVIPETIEGFGFVSIPINGLQNGSPDGMALVNNQAEILQFLSYEGTLTATDGPANGLTSEDIGIAEASNTPIGTSLQLIGTGQTYQDFTWDSGTQSFGAVNQNQSFGQGVDPIEVELKTISEVRNLPLGTQVKINGTLTVADEFGGPAYIQDNTGGIAIFDNQVHGEGVFSIGNSLEITATLSEFRGMMQLSAVTEVKEIDTDFSIDPLSVILDQISTIEGQLVQVDNVSFVVPGRLNSGNHEITDGSTSLNIRIDNSVESLIGRVKPNNPTTIIGVVGSFNGAFQILPRVLGDIPESTEFVIEPPAGEEIPRAITLDVATWNLEFFGATLPRFGPSDVELQKQNVLRVLDSLQADIIAVQEVSDKQFLMDALTEFKEGNFKVICSDVFSRSFENNNDDFPPQQLCFIYDSQKIKVLNERVIFEAFYTNARTGVTNDLADYPTGSASSFWSSGRLPYLLEVETNFNNVIDTLQIINVHAKSGRSDDDVARKRYDFGVLKDTIDTFYKDASLILLGDYNDDVDVSIGGGPTPLLPFVNDTDNFDIVSDSFSFEGLSSTVGFGSVIDHTAISNELFEPYIEDSEVLIDPQSFITDYGTTTSDHFPTVVRFLYKAPVEPLEVSVLDSIVLYQGYKPLSQQIITAVASGGVAPYTYQWSTGNVEPTQLVTTTTNLPLTITVTDSENNAVSKEVKVIVTDVSCNKAWFTGVEMCIRQKTRCVPSFAVPYLLDRGYTLGSCSVGTAAIKQETKIAPNPFNEFLGLQFDFSNPTPGFIAIYDYRGSLVYKEVYNIPSQSSQLTIDTTSFRKGFYIVKVGNAISGALLKTQIVVKF
ncbi:endonuclease/exonuclease/phosphatase family protein [Aquimarina sp. ERC-38]|uniref:DUF5689 domain-containing protein n=1 Tax=Aquimarina sp. ERC-38 TaxID=2949996 RepID=UPI002246F4E3|nr:DUF5689 domain-containing protein [Aquimarina sp. ERC-38]UZO79554.1 endonuclease/exonuclease/phosphatase family protein [Aquimarina sp. ERC-38]